MRTTLLTEDDADYILQTYLSEYSDDEAFGHLSLGRSFAFEMGASIPGTDQRLGQQILRTCYALELIVVEGALESGNQLNINTASDFMAQYTTRQEYRFSESNAQPEGSSQYLVVA